MQMVAIDLFGIVKWNNNLRDTCARQTVKIDRIDQTSRNHLIRNKNLHHIKSASKDILKKKALQNVKAFF